MCGIAGAIDLSGPRLLSAETLRAMADAIVHRGPDEDGYFREDGVSLFLRVRPSSDCGHASLMRLALHWSA